MISQQSPILRDATSRRPIGEDIKKIWERRSYIVYSSISDLRAKEMDTFLGNAWHLLNPALQISVYYVIFGLLLGTDRGVDNFLPFIAIGVFGYSFMRQTVIAGARSIVRNQGLIRSLDFPRSLLPISATGAELAAYMPPFVVMLVVSLATGEHPSLSWLALPAILFLQVMWSMGMAFIAARLTFHFPDFDNILVFLFRMAFYFSGVLFLVDRYLTNEFMRTLADLNPLLDYLSLYRWAIMDMPISQVAAISGVAWAVLTLPVGYLFFRSKESIYGT